MTKVTQRAICFLAMLLTAILPPSAFALRDCNNNGVDDSADFQSSDISFDQGQAYNSDLSLGGLNDLAFADLNGDQRPEMILSKWSPTFEVLVYLNDGQGSFKPPARFPTIEMPAAIHPSDLNGDGYIDLALVNDYENSVVTLLMNKGMQSDEWLGFAEPSDLAVPSRPYALVISDLNNDGKPDLAANGEDSIFVGLNDGNGSFTALPAIPADLGITSALVSDDFDGDGRKDLAVPDETHFGTRIFFNKQGEGGKSQFLSSILVPTASKPKWLVSADFNQDSRADLIAVDYDTHDIAVLLNKGTNAGTLEFLPAVHYSDNPPSSKILTSDLNGDGFMDLLSLGNSDAAQVAVFLNDGFGSLYRSSWRNPFYLGMSLAAADVDGDGRPDLGILYANKPPPRTLPKIQVKVSKNVTQFPYSKDLNRNAVPDECEISKVLGRGIFYGGSVWGNQIASGKKALLPGERAAFANVSNYFKGINGVAFSLSHSAETLIIGHDSAPAQGDVYVYTGDGTPDGWSAAPDPTIAVEPGAGPEGSNLVRLSWPDSTAPRNKWVKVVIHPTANTLLKTKDVFYFGNAVAEIGDSPSHFIVNATDEVVIMADAQLAGAVSIDSRSDINRDGQVNTTDVILARTNHVVPLKALKVITAPLE